MIINLAKKQKDILLIGNIKEDKSWSMHLYLKDILRKNKKVDFISPSSMIHPTLYKIFIYPFKIPRKYKLYHILDHSYSNLIYFLPKDKVIVTCHDLIPLKVDNVCSWRGKMMFWFYVYGLKRARLILVESKSTKRDIIKLLKIPSRKIRLVSFPLDLSPFYILKKNVKGKLKLKNKKVLLSVGSVSYKNTLLILKSLKEIKGIISDVILVKIGHFSKQELQYIKDYNLNNFIINKNNLSLKKMNEYYNASDILVFPSLYEGFGKPPLEAMSCGTPVITSNVSSLPEVVGIAAIKINPYSVSALTNAVLKIFSDGKLRDKSREAGLKNSKRFSLKQGVNDLKKIYSEILSQEL